MASLHSLIQRGRHAEFEALLKQHPERLEERSESGDTPLHIAAWQNRVSMLRRLIELGANLNARGWCGFAPLHYAAKQGSTKSARELMEAGADLNARDDCNFWPIHHALRGREPQCVDVVRLLEEAGASFDLSCHVMRGDAAKVRQLIAQNPNAIHQGPLARDLVYDATLWIVCQADEALHPHNASEKSQIASEHRALLDVLLDAGADVNDFRWSGESALQLARTAYNPFLMELLIARGAKT